MDRIALNSEFGITLFKSALSKTNLSCLLSVLLISLAQHFLSLHVVDKQKQGIGEGKYLKIAFTESYHKS